MAQVTYHGEYPEGSDTIVHHGYEFTRGEATNVKEPELLARFAANRFFKTGDSDKGLVEQGKADAEEAEAETLRGWLDEHQVAYHHKAGVPKLRQLKDDWTAARAAAEDS